MNHKFKIGSIVEFNHSLCLIIMFKSIRPSTFYKGRFAGDCVIYKMFKTPCHLLDTLAVYEDEIIV